MSHTVAPSLEAPQFGSMPDDKKKVGKPDRDRVSTKERYEVDDLAKKHGLPAPFVKKIVEQEGPMRKERSQDDEAEIGLI